MALTPLPPRPLPWTWWDLTRRRLREICWNGDWEMTALFLAVTTIRWGFAVLLPWVTFTPLKLADQAFAKIPHPELLLGAPMLIVGIWQLAGVFKGNRRMVAWASAGSVIGWAVIAALYSLTFSASLAPTTHGLTALFSLWLCARMWFEDGEHTAPK